MCGPSAVTRTAGRLLDDGTGAIHPPLRPLVGALAVTTSPAATLEWLATALGFHHTTTRQHINAGGVWSHYAGGGDD